MESPLTTFRTEQKVLQRDLAGRLGVQPPALSKWERGRVPASRVLDVEKVTGISRHRLRPDIYGTAQDAAE